MKFLCIIILLASIVSSCTNSYYSGNRYQDSLMRQVDNKLNYNDTVYKVWSKMLRHGDSIVSYAVNRANNELITLALSENNSARKTFYYLAKGELVKVQYFPISGNKSNFYFFDSRKLLYKRQRIADTTEPQKFLDDIIVLKKAYRVN